MFTIVFVRVLHMTNLIELGLKQKHSYKTSVIVSMLVDILRHLVAIFITNNKITKFMKILPFSCLLESFGP